MRKKGGEQVPQNFAEEGIYKGEKMKTF